MAEKRRHISKTIGEKLEIIKEVDRKEKSKSEIAKYYRIPLSTLVTYLKNRRIIEMQAIRGFQISKRKRIRGGKHINLEDELMQWFHNSRAKNIPIDGKLMKEKANELAVKLGIEEFQCSNGWLQRFKQRHNILWQPVSGTPIVVDIETENIAIASDQEENENICNSNNEKILLTRSIERKYSINGKIKFNNEQHESLINICNPKYIKTEHTENDEDKEIVNDVKEETKKLNIKIQCDNLPLKSEAFAAIALLNSIIESNTTDRTVINALNVIQDFVSRKYKDRLKQTLIDYYFKPL